MHRQRFVPLLTIIVFCCLSDRRVFAQEQQPSPASMWKPGDAWTIAMEVLARDPTAAVTAPKGRSYPYAYTLKILVTGPEPAQGVACARVDYLFGRDAPVHLTPWYQVYYERLTNRLVQAGHRVNGESLPVDIKRFGEVGLVADPPDGLPLDFLPACLFAKPASGGALKVAVTKLDKNTVETLVTLPPAVGGKSIRQIRQHWIAGEHWWSYSELTIDGRKIYAARRIPSWATRPPVKQEKAAQKVLLRPLRNDTRLHVRINMDGVNPHLQTVLEQLADATGLTFTVANNLKAHYPRFGSIQLGNVRAFLPMELIASHELEGGKWVRVKAGYHLTGVSKAPVKPYPPAGAAEEILPAPDDPYYLRRDTRLHAKITVVEVDTDLPELLARLEAVTKLSLVLDPSLAQHRPALGSMQFKNVSAWMIMELLAQSQLDAGRWERTEAGYRLQGKSLVPPPPAGPTRWPIVAGGLLALAAFFGLLVFLRYRLPPRRLS
jgi:hypothetical protein